MLLLVWIRQRRSRGRILRRIRVLGRRVLRKSKLGLMEASGCLGHGLELFCLGFVGGVLGLCEVDGKADARGRGYHPSSATARTDILSLWLTLPAGRKKDKTRAGDGSGRGASCPGIVKGQLYRRSVSAQIPKRPEEGLE